MIEYIVNQINKINARLLDVFFTGPLRIYLSQFVTHKILRNYLLIEGIMVIIFNGYSYLHFQNKNKPISINFLDNYSDPIRGKPQFHRLINLFIMYPLHIYILKTTKFTNIQASLLILNIIFGVIYNGYNYIHY